MYCIYCGAEIPDTARFCTACGKPVAAHDGAAQADAPRERTAEPPAAGPDAAPQAPEPKPRPPRAALVAGIAIAVIAVAALIYILSTQALTPRTPAPGSTGSAGSAAAAGSAATAQGSGSAAAQDAEADAESAPEPAGLSKDELVTAAQARGLATYEGTIRIFPTDADILAFQQISNPNPGSPDSGPYAVLVLPQQTPIPTYSFDRYTRSDTQTNVIDLLATDIPVEYWAGFDQMPAVLGIDLEQTYHKSDTGLPMGSADPYAAELIAVQGADGTWTAPDGAQQAAAPQPAADTAGGSYICPDSATRIYSDSELYALSLSDLELARNEIYARHGRGFNRADLQAYFDSQPWYERRYSPDEFDANAASLLNDTERANAENMLRVQNARS